MEEKLVTINTETEGSLTDGKTETKIFVKMYVDAVKGGLIADLGDGNWRTLCVIASYMNSDGTCYPSQEQIARGLGISRQAASNRVKKLADYRWNGRAIIETIKGRTVEGTWENTRYTVLPISQLRIFDSEPEALSDSDCTMQP